jgi:hypothetical protein
LKRERDKRGELYLLKFLFDFFWVDPGPPGSTHLTRDPIIRPGRPPGRVSKLWFKLTSFGLTFLKRKISKTYCFLMSFYGFLRFFMAKSN